MRVSLKLVLSGVLLLITLLACGVGLFALNTIATEEEKIAEITNNWLPSVAVVGQLNTDFSDIRIAQYRYMTTRTPEERKAASDGLAEVREALRKRKAEYEKLISSAEERRLYADYERASDLLRDQFEMRVRPLVDAGRTDEALPIFRDEGKRLFDQAANLAQQLVDYNRRGASAAGKEAEMAGAQGRWVTQVSLGVLVIVAIGAILFVFGKVIRPIAGMTDFMGKLAAGDLATAVPNRGTRNEIGDMAAAVQVFKDNMVRARELEADAERQRHAAEAQRKAEMRKLADDFERAVGGIVDMVATAATEMQATAHQLTASAQETSAQSVAVSSAAEEASTNVAAVASSSEELGSSVLEIGRQVEHSSSLSRSAVGEAEATAAIVADLSQAAVRINGIVAIISDIAGQTNLLALNATIEAARAGEAGRGFAVVAAEVKGLAEQTSKATAEIGNQIAQVQSSTERAVQAIGGISGTIRTISDTAASISAAVEQQSAATREIVKAVHQASTGTGEVTSNISGVARAAEETGASASQVLGAAGELSRQAETLRRELQTFLATVRAA